MIFRDLFILSTWWGKIIGAFFGYLIFGPVGAICGIFLGHFFDLRLSHYFFNPCWLYYSEKSQVIQTVFFEATFYIMGYLAKADGRVTEQELHRARILMNEMLLSKEQKIQAKVAFNRGKKNQFNLDAVLGELYKNCKKKQNLLRLFADIQYRFAQIDGLSAKKIQILNYMLSKLGFAPLNQQHQFYEDLDTDSTEQHQSQDSSSSSDSYSSYTNYTPQTKLDHAYALIDVSPKASKPEVKRAYRRLLSHNHPDKLIAQGLPQEMIKMANEKTHKIVKAYELICESKGW